jgi:hypothetical protein
MTLWAAGDDTPVGASRSIPNTVTRCPESISEAALVAIKASDIIGNEFTKKAMCMNSIIHNWD